MTAPPNTTPLLLRLGPTHADEVTTALSAAFAEYPVMRYVLGSGGDYAARLRVLVGFFVAGRVLRDDPIFAIAYGPELAAVAACTHPGAPPAPPALDETREDTWRALGPDARARYEQCVRAWEPLGVNEPNLHLNMIGTLPRYRGRGLGGMLLQRVHALSRELPNSRGVTLTTESPANVPLYRHHGYRIVGHGRIAPELETWGFFRPD